MKTYSEKLYEKYVKIGSLFSLALILFLAYIYVSQPSEYEGGNNITLKGKFSESVDGISKGSEVRFLGYKIGEVASVKLNSQLNPIIKMNVSNKYQIPDDSSISIQTDGYVGDKYLEIAPGFGVDYLKDGDEFMFTQDSIIVEDILSKYLATQENNEGAENE
jgi:phospholipid/cholesterol/gamma-HCH transport system substrate-binding protein